MIITKKQEEDIKSNFLKFKETGANRFPFAVNGLSSLKIYFQDEPEFVFANIMEIDGIQVYLGKDSNEVSDLLKDFENETVDETE